MKNLTRSFVASLLTLGIFHLTLVSARAAEPVALVPIAAKSAATAPKIVSAAKPLSAEELAKYQQPLPATEAAATNNAAGASSNTVVWVVVGVAVIVGVAALAGGGGGGGY